MKPKPVLASHLQSADSARCLWLYLRYVPDLVLLLHLRDQVLRQLAHDLGGVHALDVSVQTLPLGHPALARLGERDEAFEDGRGAVVDLFVAAREAEELFAVGASLSLETLHEQSQHRRQAGFVSYDRRLRGAFGSGRERTLRTITIEQTMHARNWRIWFGWT